MFAIGMHTSPGGARVAVIVSASRHLVPLSPFTAAAALRPQASLYASSLSPRMKMAAGTLFTYPDNWRAYKPLIAAQYSAISVTVASSPPEFQFGKTNKTPEFLKKFPAGKVPAYEGSDGFCVFESNAIAHYVSNEELRGRCRESQAQVIQWISFSDSEIIPPASAWVFPTLGIMQYNKQ
ncbi:hypothetical protein FKM82_023778, partial [Ascaphus truei]